jgi:hypothetical protein
VKQIDVKEGNLSSGLPPVYGSDGVQQIVSFGTSLASKEDLSTGVSCPTSSLRKQLNTSRMSDLAHGESKVDIAKCSGPNRSVDKAKRESSSPYKCPKCFAKELRIKELVSDRSGGEIKSEGQVMLDGALGTSTLDVLPANPEPMMGPRDEARQEP